MCFAENVPCLTQGMYDIKHGTVHLFHQTHFTVGINYIAPNTLFWHHAGVIL